MRRPRPRGLTLVELIVTISVAALVGIPVGLLFAEHLHAALRAGEVTVATSLARGELERLDGLNDFCHLDLNITLPTGVTAPTPNPAYVITRIVTCQTPTGPCACSCAGGCGAAINESNDIKRVDIRVTKNSPSGELVASLVSYRTKFVLFGP